MFRGIAQLNLDAKGRMAMPTRYRELISESCQGRLVITIDQDKCLSVYPQNKWDEIEEGLANTESNDDSLVALKRLLVGYATECEMDGQGRILLPTTHREWAELDKRVVLVGQIYKFEIWNEPAWMETTKETMALKKAGRLQLPPEVKVAT